MSIGEDLPEPSAEGSNKNALSPLHVSTAATGSRAQREQLKKALSAIHLSIGWDLPEPSAEGSNKNALGAIHLSIGEGLPEPSAEGSNKNLLSPFGESREN